MCVRCRRPARCVWAERSRVQPYMKSTTCLWLTCLAESPSYGAQHFSLITEPGACPCQVLETDRALLKKRGTGVLAARVARVAELLAARGFLLVHDLPKLVQVCTLSFPTFLTRSSTSQSVPHMLKTCGFLLVHKQPKLVQVRPIPIILTALLQIKACLST